MTNVPNDQLPFRCVESSCRHVFTIAEAEIVTADDSARIEEEKKKKPVPAASDMEQFMTEPSDMAKALAQDYFSDISSESAGEPGTQAAASEDEGEGTPEQQRQQLFQYAQEHPAGEQQPQEKRTGVRYQKKKPYIPRYVHEKRGQRIGCRILLLAAILIFAGRIVLTRLQGTEQVFRYLQPQIVPSGLYFCAALILIVHMLRYTARPKWLSAVLMLIPLILDAWYLFPELLSIMPADTWFMVNCGVKIAFSLFGQLRSIRAGRQPAKKYHSAPA